MKMQSQIILFLSICFINVYSQVDTLICYDCQNKNITTILPPPIDNSKDFENTSWNLGQYNNTVTFYPEDPKAIAPENNLTDIESVLTEFNMSDFPVRTVVKIFRYEDGEVRTELACSGIMVSKDIVLTAGHCLFDYTKNEIVDSLLIIPAYNNDLTNLPFGSSISSKYYLLKRFYDVGLPTNNENFLKECFSTDIGLIRLNEPIGADIGWVGIAYSESTEYYENNIFHQFSYPNQNPYNGHKMYYAKGIVNVFDDELFGIFIGNYGKAFGGQSGSSLLYSDNSKYYSIGTLKGYNDLLGSDVTFHVRITKNIFYAFKSILDSEPSSIEQDIFISELEFKLSQNYPNPFNSSTAFCFYLNKREHIVLKIYNVIGQEIVTLADSFFPAGENQVFWNVKNHSSGIYFARLQAGSNIKTIKMLLQQ